MEEILMVLNRLSSFLEQYDSADQAVSQMETQMEVLKRISAGPTKDSDNIKGKTANALSHFLEQRTTIERTIKDLTGRDVGTLRDYITELKVNLERTMQLAFEEKQLRKVFEILADADAFAPDGEAESRADYEEQLGNAKKLKEVAMTHLVKLTNLAVNKNPILPASEGVIKELHSRSINV